MGRHGFYGSVAKRSYTKNSATIIPKIHGQSKERDSRTIAPPPEYATVYQVLKKFDDMFRVVRTWNSVPRCVVSSDMLGCFKSRLIE